MKKSSTYSLRQVIDITGISEFTLRGWENRYQAFAPDRTETGRRQYSNYDLQKALVLRELIHRNHRIGDIAIWPGRESQITAGQKVEKKEFGNLEFPELKT